jgi:lipoprotein-anchoring transpeptidase ErfK/SrfK
LISSGRPNHATPAGIFRIWVKLAEDTMDDLERTDQESNYAIEGVPWVQYFSEGIGLHAAFWHDQFGAQRSHGCVNLSPRDARRLFEFTSPALPAGWDAILTTSAQPGTIVRVRD